MAGPAAGLYAQNSPEAKGCYVERGELTSTVHTPERDYYIANGIHTIPEKYGKIVEDTDGVFLELMTDHTVLPEYIMNNTLLENTEYSSMLPRMEDYNIPVYLADVEPENLSYLVGPIGYEGARDRYLHLTRDMGVTAAEVGMGAVMLRDINEYTKEEKTLSRREAFEKGFKAMLALYFLTVPISYLGRALSASTGRVNDVTSDFRNFSDRLHPEDMFFLMGFRNKLLAYKQKWIGEEERDEHYTTLTAVGHSSIEDDLQMSEEELLSDISSTRHMWKNFVNMETVYKAVKMEYDNEWKVSESYEIPELKEVALDR